VSSKVLGFGSQRPADTISEAAGFVLKESAMDTEALPKTTRPVRFGRFELDLQRGTLKADGADISLRPKTFALLAHLATNPGRLISKAELMEAIWPNVVVTDDSLTQLIGELRAVLCVPGLIQTVARRGYRLEMPPRLEELPKKGRRLALATGMATLSTGALFAWWWVRQPSRPLQLDSAFAAQRTVAVLPFVDLGGTPSPLFADGVTEDVSMAVARIPDVLVFANASTAGFVDPASAARALKATHVLSGSIEHGAGTALIRAQLLDARTGTMLWSERFEGDGQTTASWQRDIAQRIAQSLDVRMRDPLHDDLVRMPPAVAVTRQGIYLAIHARTREDLLHARALLETALAADPNSVVALTFWAFTHTQEVMRHWSVDRERQIATAAAALDRAMSLRRDYWPAYFHRSFVLYLQGHIDEAAQACEAVLALWPNEPHALQRLGFSRLLQGRAAEVASPVQLAMRLNPLEPTQAASGHFFLGMALFHQHRDDEAYAQMHAANTADSHFPFPQA
jgi:TolB-like protein/DNA-binding winged helix-turn-helix (wHTH) protein